MLLLPKTLPSELKKQFERYIHVSSLEDLVKSLTRIVFDFFQARDVLFILNQKPELRQTAAVPMYAFAIGQESRGEKTAEQVLSLWLKSQAHPYVCCELENRSSAVSYSSFSWPYPCLFDDRKNCLIPAEYTLLIPVSSTLVVSSSKDSPFSGYLVILFDTFPELTEHTIQFIITLATLLSDLIMNTSRELSNEEKFLGAYAHDIKHFLLLQQELLKLLRCEDKIQQQKAFATMERTLTKLLLATNSLLLADKELSGKLQIKPLPICLNELVTETVGELKPLFEASQIEYHLNLDPDLPRSQLDPAVFPCVIANLVDNARKYSRAGDTVEIRTRRKDPETVILEVSDYGIGISPEEKALIFTKYYRGHSKNEIPGSGLGLYLIQKIVEAHHGQVFLEEQEPKGSRFIVELKAKKRDSLTAR